MPTPDGRIGSRDLCTGAVVERVVGDGAISSLKISATLESDNYSAGSAGWQINRATGAAEFQSATIRGTLNASDIVTGTLNAALITVTNLSASSITTGTLDASQVTVTNLDADNITTGTLSANYINGGTLNGGVVTITNINASNITTGTLSAAYIGSGTTGGITINLGTAGVIQSQTGGVIIRGNGTAEFTNVTISGTLNTTYVDGSLILNSAGTIETASSGNRIKLQSSTYASRVFFYDSSWSNPGQIYSSSNGLTILPPYNSGPPGIFIYPSNGYVTCTGSGTNNLDLVAGSYGMAAYGGSESLPAYSFSGDRDTGLYLVASNHFGFTVGGSRVTSVTSQGLRGLNGSASAPPFAFINDNDSGMYLVSTGYVGIAAGGSIGMQIGPTSDKYIYGLTTGAGSGSMQWNSSTSQITYQTSSKTVKKFIAPLGRSDVGLTDLLVPSRFKMRGDKTVDDPQRWRLGLIAEDTIGVDERFGVDSPTIPNYDDRAVLAAVILDLQDARRRIKALEAA